MQDIRQQQPWHPLGPQQIARLQWEMEFIEPSQYVVHGVEPLIALFIRKHIEVDRLRESLAKILYPVAEISAS